MAEVTYDVPLIPQPDKLSCWAGSMAMLVSFRKQASYTPEQLANDVGRSLRMSYGWDELEAVKDQFGFKDIPLPSNASLYPSPQQWSDWLNDRRRAVPCHRRSRYYGRSHARRHASLDQQSMGHERIILERRS